MAEAAVLRALLTLKDEFSGTLGRAKGELGTFRQKFEEHRKAIGMGMVAVGGVITGLAALSIRAAQQEEIGISRLDQALKNVGQSYAQVGPAIEKVVEAQQRKTSYGDGAQRDALQKLLAISGQYEASLKALPVVLDVAAGASIDLNAAALLVGKALAGETSSLSRYGIMLKEGATQTEILAALTKQFAGAAEAAADPFTQLKNRVGDLQEEVGRALLPIVSGAARAIEFFTRRVVALTQEHPLLTRAIIIATAALGALALGGGGLLLLLPALTAGFAALGVVIHLALGPVGLITLALVALGAGAFLLWKNWDKIWGGIKAATEAAANFVIAGIERMANAVIAALNALMGAANKVVQFLSVGLAPELGQISEVEFPRLSLAVQEAEKAMADAGQGMESSMQQTAQGVGLAVRQMSEDVKGVVNDMGSALMRALGLQSDELQAEEEAVARQRGSAEEKRVRDSVAGTEAFLKEQQRLAQEGATAELKILDEEIRQWRDVLDAWKTGEQAILADQNIKRLAIEKQGIEDRLKEKLVGLDNELKGLQIHREQVLDIVKAAQEDELKEIQAHYKRVKDGAREQAIELLKALQDGQTEALELLASYVPEWETAGVAFADAIIGGLESRRQAVQDAINDMLRAAAPSLPSVPSPVPPGEIRHPPGHEPWPPAFPPGAKFHPMPPGLQGGAIVTRPTLALVGEKGPEAVVPLNQGRMGNVLNIIFNAPVYGLEDFRRQVAEAVRNTALGGGFYGVLAPAR